MQFYGCEPDDVRPLTRATLAVQLPQESRCVKQIDWRNSWSPEQYMLALIVDEIEALRYGLGGGKGKKPQPVKRPSKQPPAAKERKVVGRKHLDRLLFGGGKRTLVSERKLGKEG